MVTAQVTAAHKAQVIQHMIQQTTARTFSSVHPPTIPLSRSLTRPALLAALFLALFSTELIVVSAASADTLDAVKTRGELRCGVNGKTPGLSLMDGDGAWSGLDVDLGLRGKVSGGSGETDPGGDQEMLRRLEMLEAAVRKLSAHFVHRMEELERRSNWFKDKLVARFRERLLRERKRSNMLLGKYTRLGEKYKALQKERSDRKKAQATQSEERSKK